MAVTETELTIDELVARTGITSRTIREYQSLGLLTPPNKVGRVGYYDQSHVDRLGVISRLQHRGYSLAGIRDLISAWSTGAELPAVLGLDAAADAATADERPEIYDADALEGLLPGITRRTTRTRAQRAGLIEAFDDGRYCVRSPALLQFVVDATALGVTLARALQVVDGMRTAARAAATEVVDVFVTDVWTPHTDGGRPDDRDERITTFLQRGRGLLQRGAASMFIRELEGAYIKQDAPDATALRGIVSGLRVGAVTDSRRSRSGRRERYP